MTQIISWTFVQNEAGNLLVGKYKPPQDDSTHETSGPPKVLACFDLVSNPDLITAPKVLSDSRCLGRNHHRYRFGKRSRSLPH